jgi:hypothetical protein
MTTGAAREEATTPAAWRGLGAQQQQGQQQQWQARRGLTDEAKESIERTLVVDTLATVSFFPFRRRRVGVALSLSRSLALSRSTPARPSPTKTKTTGQAVRVDRHGPPLLRGHDHLHDRAHHPRPLAPRREVRQQDRAREGEREGVFVFSLFPPSLSLARRLSLCVSFAARRPQSAAKRGRAGHPPRSPRGSTPQTPWARTNTHTPTQNKTTKT